ncbi:DUF2971 domain-containing protein [Ancylobacter radicis]|uniref:DUF2971 domain-containing protein n=1 Tax=Ancylobacter radicis TaxID=2836179 RepID=A0ABS5R7I4_9HYPH|nr:DUF2971 domain-containing protein [Ancylobacter radicis]MBS9477624.1 DUF2971 domain-containing protein [Ancylobacter radicis]
MRKLIINYDDEDRLFYPIFFPYAWKKTIAAINSGQRFVHYTSAETAANICRNKEIWLRKSSLMNDFMEIEHGLNCLNYALKNNKDNFLRIINSFKEGLSDEILEWYNGWLSHFRNDTYIFCLSEHRKSEDKMGRLSMWRAYGGNCGVAIVINPRVILTPSDALNAYTSPVAYYNERDTARELRNILNNIEINRAAIEAHGGHNCVSRLMKNAFRMATLCMKHPGFKEEAEWRVIYSPKFALSNVIKRGIRSISGMPQPVYLLPLSNIPSDGLTGLEIPELVDRVIVGPNEHPEVVAEAMVDLLKDASVERAGSRVIRSEIPLRR